MIALLLAASVLNPAVTQDTIRQTICVRGYAATVRPPRAYTSAIKRRLMRQQHITARRILDHAMPIELGGSPTDPANMQLQTRTAAHRKDLVENKLHRDTCSGRKTLAEAQAAMEAYRDRK